MVVAWLKRWHWRLLDIAFVQALVFPETCSYLRWVMLGAYVLLSVLLARRLLRDRWVFRLVRDTRTRIAHGLEHATLTLLVARDLPVHEGFTHGHDRFVAVLEAGHEYALPLVRVSARRAISRIRSGQRVLAYHRGCGTSQLVFATTLWFVLFASALLTVTFGASVQICFALWVIAIRLWAAAVEPLGLVAQRLFTVSTDFAAASVVDVRLVSKAAGRTRPDDKTWFEVVVEITPADAVGGAVTPGVYAG